MQLGQPLKLSKSLFMPALISDGFECARNLENLSLNLLPGSLLTFLGELDLRQMSRCALQCSFSAG